MRAAQISEYGGKDVLSVNPDSPKPMPKAGEVLIEVKAAGVNPFDVKVRKGDVQSMGKLDFPATLGGDFSGVVAELGDDVSGFNVGDEVYGQAGALSGKGSFAEFTVAKAESVAPKPQELDFVTAAAAPLTGVSAYQALVDHAGLKSGQKVLIHGGAGGIGTVAVQLAKHLGAHVITTVAPKDMDYVKSLGVDEVIDFTTEDFTQKAKDCDVVYDLVNHDVTAKSYQVLKPGGVLVSMLAQPDEELMQKYSVKMISQFTKVTRERLEKLADLITSGAIKIHVDKTFPLDQSAEALDYLEQGKQQGKVVLQIG